MPRRVVWRTILGLLASALLVASAATPASAYGKDNWQLGFAGTATAPGTGQGSGFWGWCAFGGGVTSGNDGDCQVSDYLHLPGGGGATCERSIDVTAWDGTGGTFVISGTATSRPASPACLGTFPPIFIGFDTGFPAAAGHYNLTSFFLLPGQVGELQVQVTQIQ
jgi:hypothetical protein